jgi:hypothetical protein
MKKISLLLCGTIVFAAILTGCGAAQKTSEVKKQAVNVNGNDENEGSQNIQTLQAKNGQPTQAQSSKEVKMDKTLRKSLNIFFSNFNHRPDGNVFFECEEDVKRALEWVESAYIMSQLRE